MAETPPRGSLEHVKPRQVAQGTAVIADGRSKSHVVSGLSPGKVGATSQKFIEPTVMHRRISLIRMSISAFGVVKYFALYRSEPPLSDMT